MKLLIDANLSPTVSQKLKSVGHDAVHVADIGLLTASDSAILDAAVGQGRTIITADSDFGTLLALSARPRPSVIHLRSADQMKPAEQAELLIANLPTIQKQLEDGAIATFARGRLRLRPLPILPRPN